MDNVLHWIFPLSTKVWWKFSLDGGALQLSVVEVAVTANMALALAPIALALLRCAQQAGRQFVSVLFAMLYLVIGMVMFSSVIRGIARKLLHPLFLPG